MKQLTNQRLFLLLQIAVVAVFLGRAWQHLYWDAPYRVLLWDEDWMKPIIAGVFRIDWEAYVTDLSIDRGIQNFIRLTGGFYLICALTAVFISRWKRVGVAILWAGSVSLILLALLYCKEKFFHIGQFLEYTLQWASPLFLVFFYKDQVVNQRFVLFAKIAIALTFICHGLYAVGYYPRPGEFLQMTMAILNAEEAGALTFLNTVGVLDFVVGALLFVRGKGSKIALGYCVFWGLATTLARVWAPLAMGAGLENILLQSLHESLYRFPHFLMPLFVLSAVVLKSNFPQNLQIKTQE
jgi:hypothetical protein